MKIIEAHPGDKNYHLFGKLPETLYKKESYELKQSRSVNFDFLDTCIIVLDNQIPVARLAIYNNPGLKYKGEKTLSIGNFESINDFLVASRLFNYSFEFAKNKGAKYIIGPLNGSTWDTYRFQDNTENEPFFLEPVNLPYYCDLFRDSGFDVISKYFTILDKNPEPLTPKFTKRLNQLESQGVKIRRLDLENFDNDLRKIYDLNIQSFKNNFLYSDISFERFSEKYYPVKPLLNPEFVLLAENSKGEIVGLGFAIHDFNCKTHKRLIIKTVGIIENGLYTGLGMILAKKLSEAAFNNGYRDIICALIIENSKSGNYSLKQGEIYRTYSLFGKEL